MDILYLRRVHTWIYSTYAARVGFDDTLTVELRHHRALTRDVVSPADGCVDDLPTALESIGTIGFRVKYW